MWLTLILFLISNWYQEEKHNHIYVCVYIQPYIGVHIHIYTHTLTHIYVHVLPLPGTASCPEPIYSACYDLPTTERPDENDSFKLLLAPWLVWLSGLSASLQIQRSLIPFPVRTHAWVAGQVPSRGRVWEATMYLSHICFSPSLSL